MVGRRGNRFNFFVVFLAGLGSLSVGYSLNVVGSILGIPSFYTYFNLTLGGSSSVVGAITGCFFGGGVVGAMISAWLCDLTGRRIGVLIISIVGIVGGVLTGGAVNVGMLLTGRALSGICAGGYSTLIPVYQSELAPPAQRGRMVGAHGFMNVVGAAISVWIGLGSSFSSNLEVRWRVPLALCLLAPLLLTSVIFLLPESPRWLITQDQHEKALATLQRLHKSHEDPEGILAKEEYIQICKQLELEALHRKSFFAAMLEPGMRKRLLLGILIQFTIFSTGVLVLLNYQVILYDSLGQTGWHPILLLGVYTTYGAGMNFVNSIIIDHIGRVKLLLTGIGGCIFSLTGLVIILSFFSNSTNKIGSGFGIFFVYLFTTFFDSCLSVTLYVYCAEIYPTYMRPTGMAVCISTFFGTALLWGQLAPTAFDTIGWKYYILFIIIPALLLPLIWKLAPETKGLSLEEIAGQFGDEVALDITHMTAEEHAQLDDRVARIATNDAHGLVMSPGFTAELEKSHHLRHLEEVSKSE